MSKTIEEILAPKPEARPHIYAYSIDDKAHEELLKVGQTTRDVKQRIAEQVKTAVEDAWRTDLESHVDFDGWQYLSRHSDNNDPTKVDPTKPLVYFGSFQDLLGRDDVGNIKPKNEWIHTINWDLVVFDEYHFGAWRDTAKELFEGEDKEIVRAEARLEYAATLSEMNEDLSVLSEKEIEFLPITTKAYLYLSGTPFKALATGEFIEEQIFNWTYTDEQRANMTQIDAGGILDIAMTGTSATLLARKWESALLVNVDNEAGARAVPGRHRADGPGLPPARAAQGIQHRADESGRVRVPPLRGRLAALYWY